MSASWNLTDRRITITGNTDTATLVSDAVTAGAPAADVKQLLSTGSADVYLFNNIRFTINSGVVWADKNVVILHTYNSSNEAFTFGSSTSEFRLGYLDDTDSDKPFTSDHSTTAPEIPCCYSFKCTSSGQTWCSGEVGKFYMYGGMARFFDGQTDFYNQTWEVEFPQDTKLIQCNIEAIGGAVFVGQYRLQEVKFKLSENKGLDFKGASTQKMQDIQIHDFDVAFNFTGSQAVELRRVSLRGCTAHLEVNGLTGTITLVDSDTIASVTAIMSFGTGGIVLEGNSYNIITVDDANSLLQNVRVLTYQQSSGGSTAYGVEKLSNASGVVGEYICKRYQYDSTHTSVSGRLSYGNTAVRLRKYEYKFMDIGKVLGETGLRDRFMLLDNDYVVATESVAAAYTGITIDEANSEVDLTSAHTIQEVYDYLQATQAASGNMDIHEILKTADGQSFTLWTGWSFTGLGYLSLGSKYVVGSVVPVIINGIVSGVRCAVVKVSDGTVLVSATSTGTSINLATTYSAATNVYIRARLAGYKDFETIVTLGSTGNTVNAALIVDGEYT